MATAKKEGQNLYQKLLAITEEIGKIAKTGKNMQQGYAFIEQAQVVAEVRVQMAKHGVMIMPETVSRKMDSFTNAKGTTFIHANVASRYTIVNADDPEDRMVLEWDAGEALDTGDKATNKATTASHKFFLMKLFNISDKDDPDADSHDIQSQTKYQPHYEEPSRQVNEDPIPTPTYAVKDPDAEPTQKQMDGISDLAAKKNLSQEDKAMVMKMVLGEMPKKLNRGQASALMGYLLKTKETDIRTDIVAAHTGGEVVT